MQQFSELLLDVWREACRHIEIADSVGRITPLLRRHLPLASIHVRQFAVDRSIVETVAASTAEGRRLTLLPRDECSFTQMQALVEWCQTRRVLRAPAARLRSEFPGLAAENLSGEILVGSLVGDHGSQGALLVVGQDGAVF